MTYARYVTGGCENNAAPIIGKLASPGIGSAALVGMVNAAPEFTQHPYVINGFSDLMVEVFGEEAGKGARSAVGMSSLPGGIPVEVEAIFQVRK